MAKHFNTLNCKYLQILWHTNLSRFFFFLSVSGNHYKCRHVCIAHRGICPIGLESIDRVCKHFIVKMVVINYSIWIKRIFYRINSSFTGKLIEMRLWDMTKEVTHGRCRPNWITYKCGDLYCSDDSKTKIWGNFQENYIHSQRSRRKTSKRKSPNKIILKQTNHLLYQTNGLCSW